MTGTLIRYVLQAAVRDRLVLSVFLLMLVAVALSFFLGSAAVIEKEYFALVFMAGALRIGGVAALCLFVVFYMRQSIESKDTDFILSKPIGRPAFIFAHMAAFSVLALILTALIGGLITALSAGAIMDGHAVWTASILVENIIMVNVALFFALRLRSAVGASLACLGFYVLARMIGQILGILDSGEMHGVVVDLAEYTIQIVSVIIPRLDLMGQTSWLVYGAEKSAVTLPYIFLQGLVFSLLLFLASAFDLLRQRF